MCIGNANGMQQYIWSYFLSRAFVARFLFRFLDSYTTERRLYIPVQNCILVSTTANKIKQTRSKVIWQLLMQSYISHLPGTVFNALIIFLSLSCSIDLFWKLSEIVENMIFSLIFVLRKIWYLRHLRKIKKIWYSRISARDAL